MKKTAGGLGRGLGALLPPQPQQQTVSQASAQTPAKGNNLDVDIASSLEIRDINPNDIVENPHQPRKYFAPEDLQNLVESIKEHGILQPLVVTKKDNGTYELIAGERRLRASRKVGLNTVPVIVRQATEQQKLELAIIENIQRQELDPVEEARAYEGLADLFSLTQEEIGKQVGKSRSTIANTMRLLELAPEMLQALSDGRLTRSHARTLLAESDTAKRKDLFQSILQGGMTVRDVEARTASKSSSAKPKKDPNILAMEDQLRGSLGTKVTIDRRGDYAKVTIHTYSPEDLRELIERFTD